MRFGNLALAAIMVAGLTLPAAAQTMQTTPSSPRPTSISPSARGTMAGPGSTGATSGGTASSSSQLVDINSASSSELDALPGIGAARADAIIKNRPYKGKDDLLSRHIVPPNVYNGIKDKIIAKKS